MKKSPEVRKWKLISLGLGATLAVGIILGFSESSNVNNTQVVGSGHVVVWEDAGGVYIAGPKGTSVGRIGFGDTLIRVGPLP